MIGIIAPVLALEIVVEARDKTISALCFHPGGQGVNVARAVRALGERCALAAFNGGEPGIVLRSLLDAYGVRHQLVDMQASTKTVISFSTPGQPRQILEAPLPQVTRHEADDLFSIASVLILESKALILSGTLPPGMPTDFFARLVHLANKHKVPSVVDIAPELLESVLTARPTLVKPNLNQLRVLLHRPLNGDEQELVRAMETVRRLGASAVVTSMGNSGALASFDNSVLRIHPPTIEALEEAGAGDGMVAGLAVGLAKGYTMEQTLTLSTAAGCASVLRRGTGSFKADIPKKLKRWVEVERLR